MKDGVGMCMNYSMRMSSPWTRLFKQPVCCRHEIRSRSKVRLTRITSQQCWRIGTFSWWPGREERSGHRHVITMANVVSVAGQAITKLAA